MTQRVKDPNIGRGHISKVEMQREWLKKPAPSRSAEGRPPENPAGVAQAPERREGARPMNVVPFPRQLRLPVSFSVLEDACLLIDRGKEILARHGEGFDDFRPTADGTGT